MNSSRNNRAPRRNLSKVQQQLAAEEQERDQANRQKRHREYLERKARRDRKAASGTGQSRVRSQSSQSSRPSDVKVQGNTFTIPSSKKPQSSQSPSSLWKSAVFHQSLQMNIKLESVSIMAILK